MSAIYCEGDQIGGEMGGACSMSERDENACKIVVENVTEWGKPFGKHRRGRADNIKNHWS
jgi:hypothetical protein